MIKSKLIWNHNKTSAYLTELYSQDKAILHKHFITLIILFCLFMGILLLRLCVTIKLELEIFAKQLSRLNNKHLQITELPTKDRWYDDILYIISSMVLRILFFVQHHVPHLESINHGICLIKQFKQVMTSTVFIVHVTEHWCKHLLININVTKQRTKLEMHSSWQI